MGGRGWTEGKPRCPCMEIDEARMTKPWCGTRERALQARTRNMFYSTTRSSGSLAPRAPSPEPRAPSRRRGGFTLVELLVVITIIIILMGLLTPVVINALARAKE